MVTRSGKFYVADYKGTESMNLDTYIVQERILKDVYKWDEGKSEVDYDAEYDSAREK